MADSLGSDVYNGDRSTTTTDDSDAPPPEIDDSELGAFLMDTFDSLLEVPFEAPAAPSTTRGFVTL